MKVLIVGASVAGVATARTLRSKGHTGEIILLDAETHPPYDKPPLSKQMMTREGAAEPVPLITIEQAGDLDLELRLGVRAHKLDTRAKVVIDESGDRIGYDQLVIATGAMPRQLPFPAPPGVHTLRSLDDCRAIRERLSAGGNLTIVGAGFIGAELATAARGHGLAVTVLEALPVPMAHLFGPIVAQTLSALPAEWGVTSRNGVQVSGFLGTDQVTGVSLADGSSVDTDFVVVAVGARPVTDWLTGSGLDISDGIACDDRLRARGVADVFAAGDVARWPHRLYARDLRIEHWTNANEHAAIVAASILGLPAPAPEVPYVWSHQYGHLLQIVGRPQWGHPARIHGGLAAGENYVAAYAAPDGQLIGALCIDNTRAMMACRRAIKKGIDADVLQIPVLAAAN